jgi:DHA3 family macrolide efflux protein-like MFS transporter
MFYHFRIHVYDDEMDRVLLLVSRRSGREKMFRGKDFKSLIDYTETNRFVVFRYPPFRRYITGYTVSMLGTGMQFIANSWLALQLTGKSYSVAFVLVASALPGIVLSPLIGIYVDRFDRKWVAATTDLFRALILLGIPVLWWLGKLQPWHLYLTSFLVALGDEIYVPSAMALLREVIPTKLLLYANSATNISMQVGGLLGSGLGGIIIAFSSPINVMFINAASFILSAICISTMRRGYVSPQISGEKLESNYKFFLENLKEGARYIRGRTSLIIKYLMMLFIRSTFYTINVILAPFAKDVLHVGAQGFGYIDACYAIGAIFGNVLLPFVTRRFGAQRVMFIGLWGIGIGLFLFAISQNIITAMACYLLIGLTIQVGVLFLTAAQEETDIRYQGRVHATFNTFFALLSLIVYISMGFLANITSLRWLYMTQVVLVAIAGWIAYVAIYRKWKKARVTQDALQPLADEASYSEGTNTL